jgi:hypothetical protein
MKTVTQQTNWQALCAEQLPELRGMFERILCVARSSDGPTVGHIQLADQLIDAVVSWSENSPAQPEPEGAGVSDEGDMPRLLRRLIGAMIDYMCLPGHVITRDEWEKACLQSGRYCEPFLSGPRSLKPVPVAERPWEREGWCDEYGRCWWFNHAGIPEWQLASDGPYGDFSLPHHALPLPQSR